MHTNTQLMGKLTEVYSKRFVLKISYRLDFWDFLVLTDVPTNLFAHRGLLLNQNVWFGLLVLRESKTPKIYTNQFDVRLPDIHAS